MGSRLSILAVQLILIGHAGAESGAGLFKKGIDAYKAGKYDDAAAALEQSYRVEPKPETLFALAQAERLGGKCEKAIPRYRQLLQQTTELTVAKAIQSNLDLCAPPAPEPPPPVAVVPVVDPTPPPPPPAPPPRTIIRDVHHTDTLSVALLGAGALGSGIAVGFALRSRSTHDDAAMARTLDDSRRLHDRADRDRTLALVIGTASVATLGYAVFRILRQPETPPATTVGVVPAHGGSLVTLSRSW